MNEQRVGDHAPRTESQRGPRPQLKTRKGERSRTFTPSTLFGGTPKYDLPALNLHLRGRGARRYRACVRAIVRGFRRARPSISSLTVAGE